MNGGIFYAEERRRLLWIWMKSCLERRKKL